MDPADNAVPAAHDDGPALSTTFVNSRAVWAFGGLRVVGGLILVGIFLGTPIPFAVVGLIALVAGVGTLRSKVIVDRAGMHIRRTFGWRHLAWSDTIGFLVKPMSTRVGKMYVVVVLRSNGRSVRPYALATTNREEAESRVTLLDRLRFSRWTEPPNAP